MDFIGLAPSVRALLAATALDAVAGDPAYSLHPVRLMGSTLSACERLLRKWGLDGYGGGCLLFILLAATWVVAPSFLVAEASAWNPWIGFVLHTFLLYSLLAVRDLIDHVWAVQRAARLENLEQAREAIGNLVGRDTGMMNLEACRRAAIESLAENFVDGFLSAVFWYALLGLPGLLVFKVASTMDSMVGYKTPRYARFGWCGARLDDVMNYVPARLAWLMLGVVSLVIPGLSARKGWRVGWNQHALVPGPNPGWSEATIAGLLQRRLIGPIYKNGEIVTTLWLGDAKDPVGGSDQDLTRAVWLIVAASAVTVALAIALL